MCNKSCFCCGKQTANKFCSRSCSATYNNKHRLTGRKKQKVCTCLDCGILLDREQKRCSDCHQKKTDRSSDTIQDVVYDDQGRHNAYTKVRSRARHIAIKQGWSSCRLCGYDRHFEVCHIRPIQDFPKESLLSEVNSLSNLIPLCPNCHWEFDHGLISIDGAGIAPA
jgi:hypothetical protein